MARFTVQRLARLSGVSVRTLHYYHEIGLLIPAWVGPNGYRHYERAQLLRLQRILFHREFGVPLGEIAALLEAEGENQAQVLLRHRAKLVAERDRFSQLIATLDRTIANLNGEAPMSHADLYKGFSAEKQSEYEAWLIARYGPSMRDAIARAGQSSAKDAAMEELRMLEEALSEGMRRGLDPAAEAIQGLIARHRAWVGGMWGQICTPKAYAGLADLYLSHPDFVARYERIAHGFSAFLTDAMKAHAQRGE